MCYNLFSGNSADTWPRENFATFISRSPTISGRTDAVLGPTWSSPLNPLGPRDNIVRRPIEERISGVRSPEVRGTLDGAAVRALPDWGSTANAVSESFARRHHLKIDKSKTRSIPLLGGHFAECIGRVIGNFKFNGEQGVYRREFQVLHTSVHDVILGRSFLDETETLDKHTHRIDHTIRPCFQRGKRLFLMDESPKERIRCAVNGTAASAFPDTGCDLMLVSGEFAGRNGFKVHRGKKYRTDLELIDGSTIRTDGMVLDAELQFDVPPPLTHELDYDKYDSFLSGLSFLTSLGKNAAQTTFICDLHVVEDLPCDLILSFDFIFQNKVFARFRPLFYSAPIRAYQKGIVDMENSLMFVRNKGGKLSWFSRRRRRLPNETNSSE